MCGLLACTSRQCPANRALPPVRRNAWLVIKLENVDEQASLMILGARRKDSDVSRINAVRVSSGDSTLARSLFRDIDIPFKIEGLMDCCSWHMIFHSRYVSKQLSPTVALDA